jgi:hypothetical protein
VWDFHEERCGTASLASCVVGGGRFKGEQTVVIASYSLVEGG